MRRRLGVSPGPVGLNGPVSVNVIEEATTFSLNVAVGVTLTTCPVAPACGLVDDTVGVTLVACVVKTTST
jgi:hypothetical protein